MAHTPDQLHRFLVESADVRGEIVYLDEAWREMSAGAEYPDRVAEALGQAATAVALMSASIKFEGKLTLQVRGGGPVEMLVVQGTSAGALRGLARCQGDPAGGDLGSLFGGGQMSIIIDQGPDRDQYQGIVALTGDSMAAALENYFEVSEQLPRRLILHVSAERCVGLLLQRLPGHTDDGDGWNRVCLLADTLKTDELVELDHESLLRRLFHEERVRLLDETPMRFECSCSKQRTLAMIESLGADEARDIIAEQGRIEVICEFCGSAYRFDAIDAEQLFNASTVPGSDLRH